MRATSSIALPAASRARCASSALSCSSFAAAMARNAKRCSAIAFLEGLREADDPVHRAQRLERRVARAAEAKARRIVHVACGRFDAEAVVEAPDHAQRRREPAEGREALVARQDR